MRKTLLTLALVAGPAFLAAQQLQQPAQTPAKPAVTHHAAKTRVTPKTHAATAVRRRRAVTRAAHDTTKARAATRARARKTTPPRDSTKHPG